MFEMEIDLTGEFSGLTCSVTNASLPTGWQSGQSETGLAFDCGSDVWSSGDAVSGEVTITYTVGSSSLPQVSTGNVRGVSQ